MIRVVKWALLALALSFSSLSSLCYSAPVTVYSLRVDPNIKLKGINRSEIIEIVSSAIAEYETLSNVKFRGVSSVLIVGVPINNINPRRYAQYTGPRIEINSNLDWSDHSLFRSIILHEIGHLLKMKHSLEKDSIMHPPYYPKGLGLSDIKVLEKIYGKKEGLDELLRSFKIINDN